VNKTNFGTVLLAIGLLLIAFPYIKLQSINYIVYEDYEDALVGWGETTTSGYGTLSLSTEQAKEGSQSLKATITALSDWTQARIGKVLDTHYQELYLMSYFYIQQYQCNYPPWGTALLSLWGDSLIAEVTLNGEGKIGVYYYDNGTFKQAISTTSFPVGSWHCLEVYGKVGEGTGETTVYFDGTELTSLHAINLNNSLASAVFKFAVGIVDGYDASITLFVDKTIAATTYIEPTTEPPTTYNLQVNSEPITNIEYTLDGQTVTTGQSIVVEEGTHTITMPSSLTIGGVDYTFEQWNDGATNPTNIQKCHHRVREVER